MTVTTDAPAGTQVPAGRRVTITAPGVSPDLTAEEYHADPVPGGSLSSSGARKLLPPSCPALFRYEQDNPPEPKRTFEYGHAAHKLVLGEGPQIIVTQHDDWRTKAARADRDAIRDDGGVPLLFHEGEQVQAMAEAIRHHPIAGPLFEPGSGVAEQSLFWTDPETGVWRRARPDWVKHRGQGRRLILADYKTCRDASPEALARDVHTYGYNCQAPWYIDGAIACGLAEPDGQAGFVFVFQAKTPPYLVTVVELDAIALRIGRAKNRAALHTYAECRRTGHWPGYGDGITYLSLPAWAERNDTEEYL